jgi:3-oxoacyl-[acyl-carrier-protein] synthase I
MDHFQESYFVAPGGQPILVASLPDKTHGGAERLGLWMKYALADCAAQSGIQDISNYPICFITSESSRPHSELDDRLDSVRVVQELLNTTVHPQSVIYAGGRAGLGPALMKAIELLQSSQANFTKVMLLGVDTLLNAASINQLVAEERLVFSGSGLGMIPGEAAAAVLLELAPRQSPGLHITGIGIDQAEGRPDGSVPSRARALSRAMRQAMQQAGITTDSLNFRLSDQNGEPFFAKEAANAFTRVSEAEGLTLRILTTADGTGEIGAATGPLMLSWLHHTMGRHDGPGSNGLIHLANDLGERCALTVRWQS